MWQERAMDDVVRSGTIPSGYSGMLTIDLGALQRNYRTLADRSRPAATAAVVKADAYGLGVDQVGPALQTAGCRDFFVAQFSEAVSLRWLLADEARVYVLNGLQPGEEATAADLTVIPVLNSLEQLSLWSALAKQRGVMLPALLQVDTGMSRLGLSGQEVDALAVDRSLAEGVDLRFLMSHLACGDEHAHGQNAEQLAALHRVAALFPDLPLCLANSGGIFLGHGFHGSLARPGIALYGGTPSDAPDAAMQPVVRLDVRVVQTRTVPAGTRIGYIAGAVYFAGARLPIVGRVSMDSLTIDISALPPSTLRLGSMVEIIGPHQSLEMIAADAGTISYEILTSLGRRYHRHYVV